MKSSNMPTFPDDDDGQVLASLADCGVDLTLPRLIEFAIALPDEESATAIEKALIEQGFDAESWFDAGEPDPDDDDDDEEDNEWDDEEFGPSWTVYAKIRMVPTYADIVRIQHELTEIAQPFGGFSDGWETQVD
jgi:hypothetical protein